MGGVNRVQGRGAAVNRVQGRGVLAEARPRNVLAEGLQAHRSDRAAKQSNTARQAEGEVEHHTPNSMTK